MSAEMSDYYHPLLGGNLPTFTTDRKIARPLEELASEAIQFLSQHFPLLMPVAPPLTLLGMWSAFFKKNAEKEGKPPCHFVTLYYPYILEPKTVGEEFGHYLHFVTNPALFEKYGKDLETANLVEMVGYYSGIVYASEPHPILDKAHSEIVKAIQPYLASWERVYIDPLMIPDKELGAISASTHDGGMRAAVHLHKLFGHGFLRDLSMMEVPQVKQLLRETDFRKHLAVKGMKTNQYDKTEGYNGAGTQTALTPASVRYI